MLQDLQVSGVVAVTYAEAATGAVLQRKVFLEISQNSQESTCAESLFKKKNDSDLQLY